jgi:hypothetical protein
MTDYVHYLFTMVAEWLRHYATSCKVMGLRPDEVNDCFPIYLILSATLGPEVYSVSKENEYQKQNNNVSVEWSTDGA